MDAKPNLKSQRSLKNISHTWNALALTENADCKHQSLKGLVKGYVGFQLPLKILTEFNDAISNYPYRVSKFSMKGKLKPTYLHHTIDHGITSVTND